MLSSIVLSLQNGWGNAALISKPTGPERLLVGASYHSTMLLAPGHVLHAGQGPTYLGELDGTVSARVTAIAELFGSAGIANPQEILHRYPMSGQMLAAEMSPLEGALAAQWLQLQTVLPCHYINPDCAEVREFERHLTLAKEAGAKVPRSIVLKPGETIETV